MKARTTSMARTTAASIGALALIAGLAACSSSDAAETGAEKAISAERCEENKAAGEIGFLTGYQYQASASILEVLAAEKLGYFDALCLDVTIQPGTGDTGQSAQLVAAGTVKFTAVSQQNLMQAADSGIELLGISSYSNVGLEILMTDTDITDLTDLDGSILGHKGDMPPAVQAMLDNAGVDVASLQQVVVGYDPSVLPRGQVDSLTGFISNEPNLLEATGDDVTVWRPYDFDVPSSLGALAVNPEFAAEHPTVVEDFLRAALHAYEYCSDNGEECVGYAADISGEGYDAAHNLKIWQTEIGIIAESKAEGINLGALDLANIETLVGMLTEYKLLENELTVDDATAMFDTSFIENIYADGTLIWPAP
ncbi:ABC transporter substrate-binding protein [Salinibacterium hongtaonis]|uniref:ABC transporter substrate-binding protein n=1 Tax=Homoserinimonas hongtaonis TaxID=2079791 RepID=UPI001F544286|nr:ABC transporter substrate-binding protein [Salinibacterium hongtaonis]